MSASTVVLVHGAWHGPWCWERVVPLLEHAGLSVKTVDLPSVDADPDPAADLARDAAAVRAVLDETDGSILLVGHSYGGMVITEAATDSAGTSRARLPLCLHARAGSVAVRHHGRPGAVDRGTG